MSETPPKALKLARPAFLIGALLVLAGAIILRGIVPLEPGVVWAIVLMVPGGGLIIFGLVRQFLYARRTPCRPKVNHNRFVRILLEVFLQTCKVYYRYFAIVVGQLLCAIKPW